MFSLALRPSLTVAVPGTSGLELPGGVTSPGLGFELPLNIVLSIFQVFFICGDVESASDVETCVCFGDSLLDGRTATEGGSMLSRHTNMLGAGGK